MLTQADSIQVLGDDTSGEVEPVLVGAADRLWVTVGADHTDRKARELRRRRLQAGLRQGRSAARPGASRKSSRIGTGSMLRSFIEEGGKKVLYQEGPLAKIRAPRELIAGWRNGDKRLPAGVAMFCGTLPAIGAIRPSPRFEMELEDPVLGRKLAHAYDVQALPLIVLTLIAWLPCREALACRGAGKRTFSPAGRSGRQ